MGRGTPVYNEKNILEVPLRLFFSNYKHTFLIRTMKSWQNAILLPDGTIFFPFQNNWQV